MKTRKSNEARACFGIQHRTWPEELARSILDVLPDVKRKPDTSTTLTGWAMLRHVVHRTLLLMALPDSFFERESILSYDQSCPLDGRNSRQQLGGHGRLMPLLPQHSCEMASMDRAL